MSHINPSLSYSSSVQAISSPPPAKLQYLPVSDPTAWHADDTFDTWARRVSITIGEQHGTSIGELHQLIESLYPWCRPVVGEGFRHWHSRVEDRIKRIDFTVDAGSVGSAIRHGEQHEDWLARIALICLSLEEDESLQDLIDVMKPIVDDDPPRSMESALDWMERVRLRLEAARSARLESR